MSLPAFTVDDVFVIEGRGPVLTSRQGVSLGTFSPGDRIQCGHRVARIMGIEAFGDSQRGLLVDADPAELAAGQVWIGYPPSDTEASGCLACNGRHMEPDPDGPRGALRFCPFCRTASGNPLEDAATCRVCGADATVAFRMTQWRTGKISEYGLCDEHIAVRPGGKLQAR